MPLRFGIPTLDELLEIPAPSLPPSADRDRRTTRTPTPRTRTDASSYAIIGPDGCGKSVLALHLASRYSADCYARIMRSHDATQPVPVVLYISSDFQYAGASLVWENFLLKAPNARHVPFERTSLSLERTQREELFAELKEVLPAGDRSAGVLSLPEFLTTPRPPTRCADGGVATDVGFLDLARHTAGDDWNYVNSILAQLGSVPTPSVGGRTLPHLVIIDSVAGFETYMGKLDAYGLEQTRRARIAQCMRNAVPHSHLVFVVEEPHEGQRLPEEYVTDVVIRVRARNNLERALRTIEIEKARARNHGLGEHPFEIRGPEGSSTGEWENADAPRSRNAYVHVFHSLTHRSMLVAADVGKDRSVTGNTVSPFGTPYLDQLLTVGEPIGRRPRTRKSARGGASGGRDEVASGLKSGTTSAIIGDTSTGKSILAEKFIAEGFVQMLDDAVHLFALLTGAVAGTPSVSTGNAVNRLAAFVRESVIHANGAASLPHTPVNTFAKTCTLLFDAWKDSETATARVLERLPVSERELRPLELAQDPEQVRQDFIRDFRSRKWRSKVATALRLDPPADVNDWSTKWTNTPRVRCHFWAPELETLRKLVKDRAKLDARAAARFVVLFFRHHNLRFPGVLLTTSDRPVAEMANHCLQHVGSRLQDTMQLLWPSGRVPPQLIGALRSVLCEQLIIRRYDIENASAPALFHALQYNVLEAQRLIHGVYFPPRQDQRSPKSGRIRLVLDDAKVLSSLSPAVASDPTFLPFVMFFLEREGLTSLIVYTDAVRPNVRPVDVTNQTLQSLLKQVIMTWSVPFEGRSRVAVAVVPAQSSETNGIVRELEISRSELPVEFDNALTALKFPRTEPALSAEVTPNFELYAGLEEGRPRQVPLAVYIFEATKGFANYIDRANTLFRDTFRSMTRHETDLRRVVWGLSASDYFLLRDQTHLPTGVQLDYTTVIQVDSFWSLKALGGALLPQGDYLQQLCPVDSLRPSHEDPFALFRGMPLLEPVAGAPNRNGWRRLDYFQNTGYTSRVITFEYKKHQDKGMPDRVPFTWDFGFITVAAGPWTRASQGTSIEAPRVAKVVGSLSKPAKSKTDQVSWRDFLGACKTVAEVTAVENPTNPIPFDFAATSAESFNCLVLEIWLSEIEQTLTKLGKGRTDALRQQLDGLSRSFYVPSSPQARRTELSFERLLTYQPRSAYDAHDKQSGPSHIVQQFKHFKKKYADWLETAVPASGANEATLARGDKTLSLFEDLPLGAFCLYKTWLLLLEVFPFEELLQSAGPFGGAPARPASTRAVAARHWYRTACPATADDGPERNAYGPQLVLRMPGCYSARGDSFLATLASSRSRLLAAHAIDLLCSRRANIERLQLGVGLPVRDIIDGSACKRVPTAVHSLSTDPLQPRDNHNPRLRELTYGELCALGGDYRDLNARHRPLWLYRSGISDYDRVTTPLQKWLMRLVRWTVAFRSQVGVKWTGGFRAYDALSRYEFSPVASYPSFEAFAELCDVLAAEVQAATRR